MHSPILAVHMTYHSLLVGGNMFATILLKFVHSCIGDLCKSMQLLARRLTPQPKIRYFVHQKLVELNIAIPVVVKVLEDGLHVSHVHNVVVVLVLGHLQNEPEYKVLDILYQYM